VIVGGNANYVIRLLFASNQ